MNVDPSLIRPKHHFEGLGAGCQIRKKTLPYIYTLWGKSVHLESMVEDRQVLFTYDGKKVHRRFFSV
ncbi:hypothetical protein [Brevibacillus brevis]|uniref:hypothetical protein n=1 Tax=Brevibacillus brevis TaxID=1393 RepID=UPI001FD14C8F|nr:hypothetical protein [Brevibacillus brevis]